jgi:hypothetical protein
VSRRDSDNLKVSAPGFDPIYVHAEYEGDRPVKFRISSPGKYQDAALGALLDAIGDAATRLLTHYDPAVDSYRSWEAACAAIRGRDVR